MAHNSKPTITLVPDTWYESLLRSEGISTLKNKSNQPVFFLLLGEMKDLNISEQTEVKSKHYILSTIYLDENTETQVNFPSPIVKVFVGLFTDPNNSQGELTIFLLRELGQSQTFNVMNKHIENDDPIKGLHTTYKSFNHLLKSIQKHHNNKEKLWEIDPKVKYEPKNLENLQIY
ncbi:hypothetical protein ACTFIU_003038 [Dictyostelium citrinum]